MNAFPFLSDWIGRKWCMVTYFTLIAVAVVTETVASNWKIWVSTEFEVLFAEMNR